MSQPASIHSHHAGETKILTGPRAKLQCKTSNPLWTQESPHLILQVTLKAREHS